MKLRIKKYLSSPWGIWYRLKRDIPYWLKGKSFYNEVSNAAPSTTHTPHNDSNAIAQYHSFRKNRKASSVLYTCITNNYDNLSEIACPGYINKDWDYVCFTDNQNDIAAGHVGVWETRPLFFSDLDNTRNNRWHKMHPHKIFSEYAESIYIDSNIDILSPYLFQSIKTIDKPFILPKHPHRTCIYKEFELVLAEFMDDPKRVMKERALIAKSGMPKNYGLTENCILYRRHNEQICVQMMDEWWEMVETYSRRDQLALAWLLWKNKLQIDDITIPSVRFLTNDFCFVPHKGK